MSGYLEKAARSKDTMVFVMSAGDGLLEECIELVRELREAGVKVRILLPLFMGINAPSKSRPIFSPRPNPDLALSSLRESVTKSPLRSSSVRTSSSQDW